MQEQRQTVLQLYLLLRRLCQYICGVEETEIPLFQPPQPISVKESFLLEDSADIVACHMTTSTPQGKQKTVSTFVCSRSLFSH
eukprot:m.273402 g.273402  ORF g.273402 m.273402 type:complete len:83 (-) comp15684_c1_seq49:7945-8193(-)